MGSHALLIPLAIGAAGLAIWGLRSGGVHFGWVGQISRKGNPAGYWAGIAVYTLLALASVYFAATTQT
jgi:hypothetical protein